MNSTLDIISIISSKDQTKSWLSKIRRKAQFEVDNLWTANHKWQYVEQKLVYELSFQVPSSCNIKIQQDGTNLIYFISAVISFSELIELTQ